MHTAPITALTHTRDGRALTGGYDRALVLWDRDHRTAIWHRAEPELVNAVLATHSRVYTAGASRCVFERDLATGCLLRTLGTGHRDDLNALAIDEVAGLLVVAGEEGRVVCHRIGNDEIAWSAAVRGGCVNGLALARRGGELVLAAGDDEGFVTLFDIRGNVVGGAAFDAAVEAVVYHPAGDRFVAGLETGEIACIDRSGAVSRLSVHRSSVRSLAVARDGRIATSSYDCGIAILGAGLAVGERLRMEGEAWLGWARAMSFSPVDADRLAVASLGSAPQVWDTAARRLALPDAAPTAGLNALAVTGPRSVLAAGDAGILHAVTPHDARAVARVPSLVNAIATRADGALLAGHDGALRFVGPEPAVWGEPAGAPANAIAVSTCGLAATGYYSGEIALFDVRSGRCAGRIDALGAAVKSLVFLPGGGLVAGLADGRLVRLDPSRRKPVWERDGLTLVNSVATDGRGGVFTVGRDRTIRRWDDAGNVLARSDGHERSIKCVAVSPDGQRLATASYDGQVLIWRAGREIALEAACGLHEGPGVACVVWTDDECVASAGWDGTVRWWNDRGAFAVVRPEVA